MNSMEREKAISLCLCAMCPSFVACGEDIAYCFTAKGKSTCIREEKGCLCPGCPVLEEEGFQHVYYCTRGNESEQSGT